MPFDPFRRLRLRALGSTVPPSVEEDSDVSSPERGRPRIIHVPARKSGERLLNITADAKGTMKETARITLSLDKPSHPDRSSKKHPVASLTCPADPRQPTTKPTLIRRVTSKLNITIPSRSGTHPLRSRPSTRTLPNDMGPAAQGPRSPRATIPISPTLPNSFVSKQHREAALRERGLLPPRRDLSEQERDADERLGSVPSPRSLTVDGPTEAEQFKAIWLATNRTSENSDSECGPPVPPHLQPTRSPAPFVPPPNASVVRRSNDGMTDPPYPGRPSLCSSASPLSASSHLEVLHEEPSEQGPITPPPLSPAKLPLIVSNSSESPPSPILVESPLSCTFSSHCPGSTLESQSQSSHPPPVPEKENVYSSHRRRTSDSCDRPRKVVRSSLSKFGTRSLTNLGRSVAGSLGGQSSSTLSTADHSTSSIVQAPRMAIDPTMHSLGSIIRQTRDIKDAESRRLSELAFLD